MHFVKNLFKIEFYSFEIEFRNSKPNVPKAPNMPCKKCFSIKKEIYQNQITLQGMRGLKNEKKNNNNTFLSQLSNNHEVKFDKHNTIVYQNVEKTNTKY